MLKNLGFNFKEKPVKIFKQEFVSFDLHLKDHSDCWEDWSKVVWGAIRLEASGPIKMLW